MSLADVAGEAAAMALRAEARAAEPTKGQCPFHGVQPDPFNEWLDTGLQCMAGRREFRLGRYFVARFRDGGEYAKAFAAFRREVAEGHKTGLLALLIHDEGRSRTAADELGLLGAAMREAGLTDDPAGLIAGGTLATPIEVPCPVTGKDTTYEFFSVAFCRGAANPRDPLYDPSLGAPFTAINTTSDAYAFARLVHDQAVKMWDRPPYEMVHDRDALELLFRKCVVAWQNMSTTTIQNYARVTVDPARGVHLTEDRHHWVAAHNDPVFGELEKRPHLHEMPIVYAQRLTAKWSANLFDGKPYVPSRDGQSGGVPVFEDDGLFDELYQF